MDFFILHSIGTLIIKTSYSFFFIQKSNNSVEVIISNKINKVNLF